MLDRPVHKCLPNSLHLLHDPFLQRIKLLLLAIRLTMGVSPRQTKRSPLILYPSAVNSGSSALRLAFESLCIEAGREVLVPVPTFISTAYAISDAGLVPVFVDVDPQTLTIHPRAAQAAVTKKTAVIVPVHLHGQMADMLPLLDLADTYGLYVVEDAAQAHGATYTYSSSSSSYAGSMGDLGCFSLNGVKNMGGLFDGGMVTVSARLLARDRAVADRLRGLRDLGRYSNARNSWRRNACWNWLNWTPGTRAGARSRPVIARR